MISKIKINNFQSHKKTELNLSEGVNVLIGSSDTGKSVIIRALCWLLYNNPLVDKQCSIDNQFRSNWGGDTSIEATLVNGNEITNLSRVRTNKENYYQLEDEKFQAIKTEFPLPVQKLLNVSELNIQQQLDSSFLLHGMSGGKIAEYLNKVVNLEIIDTSLLNINRKITGLNKDISSAEAVISGDAETLDSLGWVELAEQDLNVLESLQADFTQARDNYIELAGLIDNIEEAELALEKYSEVDQAEEDYVDLIIDHEEFKYLSSDFDDLSSVVESIEDAESSISEYENVDTALIECNELLEKSNRFEKDSLYSGTLEGLTIMINDAEFDMLEQGKKLTELEKEYENLKPDECPLCGGEM